MGSVQALEQGLVLIRLGLSCRGAACRVGVTRDALRAWVMLSGMRLQKGRLGGLAEVRVKGRGPRVVAPVGPFLDSNGRLDLPGRVLIQVRVGDGWSFRRIAAELGVAASTVSREIANHQVGGVYQAWDAHRAAVASREVSDCLCKRSGRILKEIDYDHDQRC